MNRTNIPKFLNEEKMESYLAPFDPSFSPSFPYRNHLEQSSKGFLATRLVTEAHSGRPEHSRTYFAKLSCVSGKRMLCFLATEAKSKKLAEALAFAAACTIICPNDIPAISHVEVIAEKAEKDLTPPMKVFVPPPSDNAGLVRALAVKDMELQALKNAVIDFAIYFIPVYAAHPDDEALAEAWNKLMHASNGNPSQKEYLNLGDQAEVIRDAHWSFNSVPRESGIYIFTGKNIKSPNPAAWRVGGSLSTHLNLKSKLTSHMGVGKSIDFEEGKAYQFKVKHVDSKPNLRGTDLLRCSKCSALVEIPMNRTIPLHECLTVPLMPLDSGSDTDDDNSEEPDVALVPHYVLVDTGKHKKTTVRQYRLDEEQSKRNKEQHALNGNIEPKASAKPQRTAKTPQRRSKKPARQRTQRRVVQQVRQHAKKHKGAEGHRLNFVEKSGRLTALERIVGSLTMPGDMPAVRYSGDFTNTATALANPFTIENLSFYTLDAVPTDPFCQLPVNESFVAQFRDPLCAEIKYQVPPDNTPWVYNMVFVDPEDDQSQANPTGSLILTTEFQSPTVLGMSFDTVSGTHTWAPHGDFVFPGTVHEKPDMRFFWFDNETEFSVTAYITAWGDTAPPPNSVNANLYFWNGNSVETSQTNLFNGTDPTVLFPITKSGYYALAFNALASGGVVNDVLAFQAQSSMVGSTFGHRYLPGLLDNVAAVSSIVLQGASTLISEVAAPVNKQGKICARQFPPTVNWYRVATSGWAKVAKSKNIFVEPIEKGCYGFLKPASENDFDLNIELKVTEGVLNCSVWPLRRKHDYLVFQASVESTEGRDLYVTTKYSVEFESNDTWREVSDVRFPANLWRAAWPILKSTPQFHENPTHWREIFAKILSGAKKATSIATKALPLIEAGAALF